VFKKQRGESYRHYVERIRTDKAIQLVTEGKWVKEVMAATEYKNRGTFNNAFKRDTNTLLDSLKNNLEPILM
jgi:AraC-like DNA-binding protein